MIQIAIFYFLAGLCIGVFISIEVWERTLGAEYQECIDAIAALNRRLRRELSERENKTRVEGDEWKDG